MKDNLVAILESFIDGRYLQDICLAVQRKDACVGVVCRDCPFNSDSNMIEIIKEIEGE